MERSKADKTSRATASADSTAKAYCPRGLVFLNNRHYDPQTGVFLSVDPLVAKTMQPYLYGAANPVTFSDPTGLEPRPNHEGIGRRRVVGPDGTGYGTVHRPRPGTGSIASSPLPTSPAAGAARGCGGFWGRVCPADAPEVTGTSGANRSLDDIVVGPILKQAALGGLTDFFCGLAGQNCTYDGGEAGPDKIDAIARDELIEWSHATAVYGCGTSASGASITCVDSQRIPSRQAADAVTIGHYVFCQDRCEDDLLLAHEFVHVRQFEINGDQQAVNYIARFAIDGYRGNSYEQEAYNVQNHLRPLWER